MTFLRSLGARVSQDSGDIEIAIPSGERSHVNAVLGRLIAQDADIRHLGRKGSLEEVFMETIAR